MGKEEKEWTYAYNYSFNEVTGGLMGTFDYFYTVVQFGKKLFGTCWNWF